MKTTLISNLGPLLRAFYAFLIVIAALWAMPRNACAQLYVTQAGERGALVSEYNANTGKLIKAKFIKGVLLVGLAVSDNDNILFVTSAGTGTVGKYDATTGATINTSFITGLDYPVGLAVNGKTLFVGNGILTASVGKYNANTGKAINASFITGLLHPLGIVRMRPAPSLPTQSFLFVSESGPTDLGSVGKYNASTGATINASFITGLTDAEGLVVLGNTLFVASYGSTPNGGGTIGEYDATTGAVINANFITGLSYPTGLALLGNSLFVVNYLTGTVGKYDATTGAAINASFITGLTQPSEIAVKRAK
jgi:hypothetical protein